MSQQPKQKKPFLKKGTRKFLASGKTTKVQIVDYGASQFFDDPFHNSTNQKGSKKNNSQEQEIQVKVKPTTNKNFPKPEILQNRKIQRQPISNTSASKIRRDISSNKKKQATLSDYLDNDSQDDLPKVSKKKQTKNNFLQQKKPKVAPKGSLLTSNLVRQDLDEEEDNPSFSFNNNSSFKPIQNPMKKKIPTPTPPVNKNDDEDQEVNFVFNSQDSEQEPDKTQTFGNKRGNHSPINRKENIGSQNYQPEPNKGPSKIKMNYFNNNKTQNTKTLQQNHIPVQPKILTIADIPKQLKQEVVRQAIAEKEQQLQNQLMKLKEKVASVTKTKEKLEQQHKAVSKMRLQFDKQMEQKQKQFDEKIKAENNKLARQKKYMKDIQMSNKGDWKAKSQVADLKKALDELKEEKRKVQLKYKTQNENLRKKLSEQSQKNKLLGQQVKMLQYGKLIQQEQMQQKAKQNKKNIQLTHWQDAPKETHLNRLFNKDFSLIQMQLQQFHYRMNEYYQYYEKVKDQPSILQSETSDDQKIKRIYKNGKVEHEYYNKFLKEIYPFKYHIVTFLNGDIKQSLPEGIKIYASNQNVIEYSIKNSSFSRDIHYFPKNQIVQMEYCDLQDQSKSYSEVYNGEQLKKIFSNGATVFQKRDHLGGIIQYTSNLV